MKKALFITILITITAGLGNKLFPADYQEEPSDLALATAPFEIVPGYTGYRFRNCDIAFYIFEKASTDTDEDVDLIGVMHTSTPKGSKTKDANDLLIYIMRPYIDLEPFGNHRIGKGSINGYKFGEQLIYEQADDEGYNGLYVAILQAPRNKDGIIAVSYNLYWSKDMSDLDEKLAGVREFVNAIRFKTKTRHK